MPSAGKRGFQPDVDDCRHFRRWNEFGPQDQDVGIVVLAGKNGRLFVVTKRGIDPVHFIGRDRMPNARHANEDSFGILGFSDLPGQFIRQLRVVAGRLIVGPQIFNRVALLEQSRFDFIF